MAWKLVIAESYTLLMIMAFWREEQGGSFGDALKSRHVIPVLVAVAMAVRIYYGLSSRGFYGDINIFKAWCDYCAEGFTSLYRSGRFVDYPPFIMYFLVVFGLLRKSIGFEFDSLIFTFMIKLLGIAFDLAMFRAVYHISRERLSQSKTAILSIALMLNPAVIFNSSLWGQVDSMLVFPLILTMVFLEKDKPVHAGIAYRIAVMTKPQALLIGPVLLFYMICEKDPVKLMKAVVSGLVSIFVIILPFSLEGGFGWIIDLFLSTMGRYRAYSMNAYNLYVLMGKNVVGIDSGGLAGYINYIVLAVSMLVLFPLYRRKHTEGRTGEGMFEGSMMFILTFFTLCTMMHERYLYPAVIFSLIAFIYSRRNEFFYIFLALTSATYLNISAVFFKYEGKEIPVMLEKSLALFEVIVFIITLYFILIRPILSERKEREIDERGNISDGRSL